MRGTRNQRIKVVADATVNAKNLTLVDTASVTWTVALDAATEAAEISATASGGGGGGTSDHALLTHLAWSASAHTGTANRIAGFDGTGATTYYQIGVDIQAYDADLTALGGLGNGLPYRSGGSWAAYSLGTGLVVSGGSIAVDTSTIATQAWVGSGYQPLDSDLTALAALSSTGLVARTGAGTVATRQLVGGVGVSVTYPDGVSGNPTIDFEPEARNASFYVQRWGVSGDLTDATYPIFFNGTITYVVAGLNNFPEARSTTAAAIVTNGFRSNATIFSLNQGFIHNFLIVTGPDKSNLRWRIGLFSGAIGTALKPGGPVAMVVFDPDSGQANATTNWYLLTYDGGGGAVAYADLGVACNVDTAYQIELIPTAASVAARVRVAGGTWGSVVSSTTSLPAGATTCYAAMLTNTTTATLRRIGFRAHSVYKEFA